MIVFKNWTGWFAIFLMSSISLLFYYSHLTDKESASGVVFVPQILEAETIFLDKNKTLKFAALNTTSKPIFYKGSNWTCGKTGCLSVKVDDETDTIPPGGSISLTAFISSRSVGDFDCTIETYFESGGVLKTVPLRALGKVVEHSTQSNSEVSK